MATFYGDAGGVPVNDLAYITVYDVLYGGDGADTLGASAAGANYVEGGRAGDYLFVAAAGNDGFASIYGGQGADLAFGGQIADSIYGGGDDDLLMGGLFNLLPAGGRATHAEPSGNDVLDGGAGNDAIYGFDGADAIFGGDGHDAMIVITVANAPFLGGGTRTILAGLYGGDGNDFIDGGRGNDDISGGGNADILNGGDGTDRFHFDATLDKINNVDTILDFAVGVDKIALSQTIFAAIGPKLSNGEFYLGGRAHDGSDRIVYKESKGKLFYDEDGQGGDPKVLFALLDKHLDLHASDFVMVA